VRTGTANLPLHYGKAPRWLFDRMTGLAGEIATVIVEEHGTAELLRRLSDPFWFQSLGCVLGFDWHSSGLTTTACGALKEGLRGRQQELGVFVAGGKGATSRRTPQEIEKAGASLSVEPEGLIYASRMAAKVDSAALQDGYQIYHHTFVFDSAGMWCVIQQGMNTSTRFARRYHWLGEGVQDFVCEPHAAICCDREGEVLNMVARESEDARRASALISHERPDVLINELQSLQRLELPARHEVRLAEVHPDRLRASSSKRMSNSRAVSRRSWACRVWAPRPSVPLAWSQNWSMARPPAFRIRCATASLTAAKMDIPIPWTVQTTTAPSPCWSRPSRGPGLATGRGCRP
jgi:hypothetical protein